MNTVTVLHGTSIFSMPDLTAAEGFNGANLSRHGSQSNKEEAHGFSRGRNPPILITNYER